MLYVGRNRGANYNIANIMAAHRALPGVDEVYVGFMEPVLRGANYNIANIMAEELPEDEAQLFTEHFQSTLAQLSSSLNLDEVYEYDHDRRRRDANPGEHMPVFLVAAPCGWARCEPDGP